jgi:hypothetical protein
LLKPLGELRLEESQQVTVTITDVVVQADDASAFFTPEEWERAASDTVTWREVQQNLANVPGSLSAEVTEQREGR